MATVEIKYAERPRSPMASTPAELRIHEAMKRALETPTKRDEESIARPATWVSLDERILKLLPGTREEGIKLSHLVAELGSRQEVRDWLNYFLRMGRVKRERLKERGGPYIYWKVKDA